MYVQLHLNVLQRVFEKWHKEPSALLRLVNHLHKLCHNTVFEIFIFVSVFFDIHT